MICINIKNKGKRREKIKGEMGMKYMKISAITVMLLILTACGSQTTDNKKEVSQQKNETVPKQSESTEKINDEAYESAQDKTPSFEQLNERERVALLFFADDIGDKSVTAEDIIKGQYEFEGFKTEIRDLNQVTVKPIADMMNQPEGMKFYTLETPKSNFVTVVGISDEKGMVGGTQGALMDYKELAETSVEFELAPIYEEQKKSEDYRAVMKKLKFQSDHSQQGEKATYMTRYRSQIYDEINKFEGQAVDTENYDWDPSLQVEKDGWTITFRDKQTGDVAGYYTVKDGNVVKLDSRGMQIKPAQ